MLEVDSPLKVVNFVGLAATKSVLCGSLYGANSSPPSFTKSHRLRLHVNCSGTKQSNEAVPSLLGSLPKPASSDGGISIYRN